MRFLAAFFTALALVAIPPASAHNHTGPRLAATGLTNATVLVVRHAEKAEFGPGLSPAGESRARAYARYFHPFILSRERLRVDTLVAAADSRGSYRSRLTLEPLSRVSGLAIQQPFRDRDIGGLAAWLAQGPPGRTILIAWHHGELPRLMSDLGLAPSTLLPGGDWPSDEYNWVIVLRFDRNGAIAPSWCRLIREPTPLG